MEFGQFVKDKLLMISFQAAGMLAIVLYLGGIGVALEQLLLIIFVWGICVTIGIVMEYRRREKYLSDLYDTVTGLGKKYLISDVMQEPQTTDDEVYRQLLHMANKSMVEEIEAVKRERKSYQEFIEQWVHEIKTPLAAMKLVCENNLENKKDKMFCEMEMANLYVEQVLYYAKGECDWKDYLLKEVNLMTIINQAVLNIKNVIREKGVHLDIRCDANVITDAKWITFIIEQCLLNSCQYGSTSVTMYIDIEGRSTIFSMVDNGIGIPEHEISRVCEKGFTGSNGRSYQKSTGMGLYLCKRLCDQLDVKFELDSKERFFTAIHITFTSARN